MMGGSDPHWGYGHRVKPYHRAAIYFIRFSIDAVTAQHGSNFDSRWAARTSGAITRFHFKLSTYGRRLDMGVES
jgi:hypothetical protein